MIAVKESWLSKKNANRILRDVNYYDDAAFVRFLPCLIFQASRTRERGIDIRKIMGALEDLKVLDISGEKGEYCSKLFADMGAEVILVEKPEGNETRCREPFIEHVIHPEKSLHFLYFNTNKKSITLDLETIEGREIFRKLVKKVDVLIESFPPGKMEAMGLNYENLRILNPGLILSSITGFGQTGPHRDMAYSDLVIQAMGGILFISGNPDEPPASLPCSAAYLQASLNSAVGILIALFQRDYDGTGQHVDISAQECVAMTLEAVPYEYYFNSQIHHREGGKAGFPRGIFPCKDGHIAVNAPRAGWEALVAWLEEEGVADDLGQEQWQNPKYRKENLDHLNQVLLDFFRNRTKEELYHEAQKRRIPFCPVNTPEDVIKDAQLTARDYFVSVEHPELGKSLTYPGIPYHFSETPCSMSRRAPFLGEHNSEIYEEYLGMTRDEINVLKAKGSI
jgi:benzylsuccinate CoA-transferase BbsE subunit